MSEVPAPSGNWYNGQPYNQSNWDNQSNSLDNILDNGYLIVQGNTTLANVAVSGTSNLTNLVVSGTTTLASLDFTGALDLNSSKITSLANGTISTDAVNKSQLDTKINSASGSGTGQMTLTHSSGAQLKLVSTSSTSNLILQNTDAFNGSRIEILDSASLPVASFQTANAAGQLYTYIGATSAMMLSATSINCLLPTNITGTLTMTSGGASPIDMQSNNITNGGTINATAITGTSLTLSLPITQNAVGSVYSTTLNNSVSQLGGYFFTIGTQFDLFTIGSSNTQNLQLFSLPPGIWNASCTINIANSSPTTASITRIRYGFNTGAASITTPYANTTIKQDVRALSINTAGANNQIFNFNEILLNSTGTLTNVYLNANIVWTGPTALGFTIQNVNLNLVRIA